MKQAPLIPAKLITICLAGAAALAQQAVAQPILVHSSGSGTSRPLWEIAASSPAKGSGGQGVLPLRPGHPGRGPAESGDGNDQGQNDQGDSPGKARPHVSASGIGADGVAPPDTNGAAGGTQYVQIANTVLSVYDKNTLGLILGNVDIAAIWGKSSTPLTATCWFGDGGDPVVLYDKAANRWVVGQINAFYSSYCIAVSTTSDATGSYNAYEYSFPNLPDYPKLGVWPDAYYFSANSFAGGSSFIGAIACAMDRATMLAGGNPLMICFQKGTSVASLLPSDLDGSTAPPAGAPNYYLELESSTTLGLFKYHVDFATPSNSTFTGPTSIPVTSYSEACGGGTCIPQQGTSQQLDSLGDRLMFRLAYRNFGDHEALVTNHSVKAGTAVGVRWYEIWNPGTAPAVHQQGTFAPSDGNYRWMGSIAMDKSGDMAVGYSEAGANMHPSIFYTGRQATDALNTMQTETSILTGTGSQTSGLSRWGDYSAMSIDPVDDCTFYYTNEYIPSDGTFNWATWIQAFKFPSCGGAPAPDFSLSASPASQSVTAGGSTSPYTVTINPLNGFGGPVSLSITSALPSGVGYNFIPNQTSTSSSLTITTSSTTPAGSYPLTITGTGGGLTRTTSVTLVVMDFSLSSNPTSRTVVQGSGTTYAVTINRLQGFAGGVTFSVGGLPTGAGGSFSSNPANGTSSTLTITTLATTPTGTYPLTITGTSGGLTHTMPVTLTVNGAAADFGISVTNPSITIRRSSSGSNTVDLTTIGSASSVTLSASGPSRVTFSFSPNPASSGGTSTMSITVNRKASTGSFTVTVTGNNGTKVHSTTFTLNIN